MNNYIYGEELIEYDFVGNIIPNEKYTGEVLVKEEIIPSEKYKAEIFIKKNIIFNFFVDD